MTPEQIAALYRDQSGAILATLIRRLGDFDLAEESLQKAFAAAIDQWPREGARSSRSRGSCRPPSTRPSIACGAASLYTEKLGKLAEIAEIERSTFGTVDDRPIPDDLLRLLFTCCHPALAIDAQVALAPADARRPPTEEIARAFLDPSRDPRATPRRAKKKIRDAAIPYRIPESHDLPRAPRCRARRRLPDLHRGPRRDPRRRSDPGRSLRRSDPPGALAPCASSPTRASRAGCSPWLAPHRRAPPRRSTATARSCRSRNRTVRPGIGRSSRKGPRCSTASSAAGRSAPTRCRRRSPRCTAAPRAEDTAWSEIAALYGLLARVSPSPVVELNRAIAVAMAEAPSAGSRCSTRSRRAASSTTITSSPPPAPISSGAPAGAPKRPKLPPRAHARWQRGRAPLPRAPPPRGERAVT